jgi:hypothetical protein
VGPGAGRNDLTHYNSVCTRSTWVLAVDPATSFNTAGGSNDLEHTMADAMVRALQQHMLPSATDGQVDIGKVIQHLCELLTSVNSEAVAVDMARAAGNVNQATTPCGAGEQVTDTEEYEERVGGV